MAFSSTVIKKYIFGNRWVIGGSWNSAAVTGGAIATGLKRVEICFICHKGSAVEADVAVINATFPLASGNVTIVASSGDTGYWLAIGKK